MPIPPYSMNPGQNYTFSVMANYEGSAAYQFNITLMTEKDTIFANAGATSLMGVENSLMLSATIINNAYEELDMSIYSCSWECRNSDTSPCKLASNPNTSLNLSNHSSCSGVDISGKLAKGVYTFLVTVTNKITGSTCVGSEAHLTIDPGLIPVAIMGASSLKPGVNDTFFMNAYIDPSTTTDDIDSFTYTWSTQSKCGDKTYPTLEMKQGYGHPLATDPNGNFLKFNPGFLLPSTTYCFQVDIENENHRGYSQMLVTTRDVPSG